MKNNDKKSQVKVWRESIAKLERLKKLFPLCLPDSLLCCWRIVIAFLSPSEALLAAYATGTLKFATDFCQMLKLSSLPPSASPEIAVAEKEGKDDKEKDNKEALSWIHDGFSELWGSDEALSDFCWLVMSYSSFQVRESCFLYSLQHWGWTEKLACFLARAVFFLPQISSQESTPPTVSWSGLHRPQDRFRLYNNLINHKYEVEFSEFLRQNPQVKGEEGVERLLLCLIKNREFHLVADLLPHGLYPYWSEERLERNLVALAKRLVTFASCDSFAVYLQEFPNDRLQGLALLLLAIRGAQTKKAQMVFEAVKSLHLSSCSPLCCTCPLMRKALSRGVKLAGKCGNADLVNYFLTQGASARGVRFLAEKFGHSHIVSLLDALTL